MPDSVTLDSSTFLAIILAVLAAFSLWVLPNYFKILNKGVNYSFRVAVIGLPRTGKTSIITVVFNRLITGKIARYISVTGAETVDRITNLMLEINNGVNLGPTNDNDVFAYRFSVTKSFPIKRKYDVEVADFPGEYSEMLGEDLISQQENQGLFKRKFLSWVLRADRYIFTIDLVRFRQSFIDGVSEKYAANIDIKFKNAVLLLKQELLDEDVYRRPVLVVFSKADALLVPKEEFLGQYDQHGVAKDSVVLPKKFITTIDIEKLISSYSIEYEFSELLQFMRSNFKSVETVYHSSYSTENYFGISNQTIASFCSPISLDN